MTQFDRSAFVGTFVQEAREYLDLLNRGVVELEKKPDDADLLTELLRAAHTLKGSSRMLKFLDINQVAHAVEDILEGIRDGQMEMSVEVGDLFFVALDRIGSCIEGIAEGREEDEDVRDLCRSLESLKTEVEAIPEPVPETAGDAPQEVPPQSDRSAFVGTFVQEAREYLDLLNRGVVELEKKPDDADLLTELLRAAHTLKGSSQMLDYLDISQVSHAVEDILEGIRDGQMEMSAEVGDLFFVAFDRIGSCIEGIAEGREENEDVRDLCRSLESLKTEVEATPEPVSETAGDAPQTDVETQERTPMELVRPASEKTAPPAESGREKPMAPAMAVEETVRIGIPSLDATIRLAGEIRVSGMRLDHNLDELAETRKMLRYYQGDIERRMEGEEGENGHGEDLEQFCRDTRTLYAKIDDLYRKYREDLAGLERMAAELQEKTLDMRMLPLSTLFDALPRAVRDLSRASGKEIELTVEGAETQMDKKLIEKLGGPLTHLVRNCIDHGIETPAERQMADKPAAGSLRIAASQEGDQVVVVVEDDGKGIDIETVGQKGVQKGLIDAEQLGSMSAREIAHLIFLPGFSTAPIITDISGRGVGMDVVKSTVEELKGVVSVETGKGMGSRFSLQLPMTLTTVRAMLVECAGFTYAVPLGYMTETVQIGEADIIQVVDREAISLKNEMIPIARLSRILGLEDSAKENREDCFVLIVRSDREHAALIVDAIVDEQDILLKPLPSHMGETPCVSGVSIFGDNQISVVLHVPGVVDSMKMTGSVRQSAPERSAGSTGSAILVVDDSLNTREIEKSILEAHGYEVDLAADGIEGLAMAKDRQYDMIVTDVDMPRMDGFSLVEHLRREADSEHTPIVIVTSREKEEDKRRGIEVGADAYILKSGFDQSNLIDTIESLIG
jgi:two-component system, chemotaxis family, sensor kinase CheA